MSHFFGLDRNPPPPRRDSALGAVSSSLFGTTSLDQIANVQQRMTERKRQDQFRIQDRSLSGREMLENRPYTDLFYDDLDSRAIIRDPLIKSPGYVLGPKDRESLIRSIEPKYEGLPERSIYIERQLNNPFDRTRTLSHEAAHLLSFDVVETDWARFWMDADSAIAEYRERRGTPTEEQPWSEMNELMHRFPGVGDNPYEDPDNPWGGPVELFATMAQMSDGVLGRIPPRMRSYFDLILGDPTENWPAYSQTEEYKTSMWHRNLADKTEVARRDLEAIWEELDEDEQDALIVEWLEAQPRPGGTVVPGPGFRSDG